eukprot:gnl/Trimastix_PCT/117.p1 GENE.gnl/Trimastix_PCT/117~~gnl/Trimastix_PCT/117.p1  ORF type:complete len:145 (-),score=28.38 gnl/Trimastix_PCT/117:129-563(-)
MNPGLKMKPGRIATAQIGGEGKPPRKGRSVRQTHGSDERRIAATLKSCGASQIPIDQVDLWKDSGEVIQFKAPKVQANLNANMLCVSGTASHKTPEDILEELKRLQQQIPLAATQKESAPAASTEDMPELIGSFEDATAAPATE